MDDLIVYKIKDNSYFIVVNASNKDKDYQWMKDHVSGDVELKDISGQVGQLALQGPKALDVLKKVADPDASRISIIPLRRTAASTEFPALSPKQDIRVRMEWKSTWPGRRSQSVGAAVGKRAGRKD